MWQWWARECRGAVDTDGDVFARVPVLSTASVSRQESHSSMGMLGDDWLAEQHPRIRKLFDGKDGSEILD